MNKAFNSIASGVFALTFLASLACAAEKPIVGTDAYKAFEAKMIKDHGFKLDDLKALFSKAEYKQSIIDSISRPAESTMTWARYQTIFLKDRWINMGAEFWKENKAILDRAEKQYGVDPAIIVAIIGVETRYGDITGGYRVIDALSTLSFHYPKRAKFFVGQLEEILLIARQENVDPLSLNGSYAGAMGMPQFIPTSYTHYAVDFNNDGVRDLWDSNADVIGSVANYFAEHKWQAGGPVAFPVKVEGSAWQDVRSRHGKATHTGLELAAMGISIPMGIGSNAKLGFLEFEGTEKLEHWITGNNFYVITRYNHSKLYAMAVLQLAEKIRNQYVSK
jgi:membrane-bound lytic murein transglycosylase B